MTIAIYGTTFNEHSAEATRRLLTVLHQYDIRPVLYQPLLQYLQTLPDELPLIAGYFTSHLDLHPDTQFLMSVGGDGTFLNSITIVRNSGIPIVGVNIGRLGFLATVAATELQTFVGKLVANEWPIEERSLLHMNTENNLFSDFPYALNDITIQKQATGLITIHTWSNNEPLNSYWADGLIVSTPTGSTAYSLSVGGPVVVPQSQVFCISPIAPHNLNIRPLIIPDSDVLRLKTECRNKHFFVTLDSRSAEYPSGTEFELRRADFSIKVVKSTLFYATLRNKMMWGADIRN